MTDNEIYLVPPAPNKELPFLVFNLLHFPSDAAAKEYEETIGNWWPNVMIFLGRISDANGASVNAITQQFTHIIVWRLQNFDEYRRSQESYGPILEKSSKPEGPWPAYLMDHGWGFWAPDQKDPILREHGLEEWNKRLQAEAWAAAKYDNPERIVEWQKAIAKNIKGSNFAEHQPVVKR